MQSHDIDLWADGVRITLEKMCQNNGVDIVGLMDYDMPASSMIGRTDERSSDMHVEWTDTTMFDSEFDDALFSMDDDLAPDSMGSENVPHATHSPFERYGADMDIPGMFGAALKAYGNAVAVMHKEGVDPSTYTRYFKSEWDLTDEDDDLLESVVPIMRSEGDAMWGGIKRKLVPYCASLPASQVNLKVVQHGKTRRDMGDGALVDWNRATEVAKAICVQLIADDVYVHGQVGRIDFAIDRRKVPIAPDKTFVPAFQTASRASAHIRPDTSAVKSYLSQVREVSGTIVANYAGGAITMIAESEFSGLDVVRTIRAMNPPIVELGINTKYNYDDMDYGRSKPIRIDRRGDIASVEDVLTQFAKSAVAQGKYDGYREWQIEEAINDATEAKNQVYLRKVVDIAFPIPFLSCAVHIWKVIKKASGGNFVGHLCQYLHAPTGVMRDLNYARWWGQVRNIDECTVRLAEIIVREVRKMHKHGHVSNKIITRLLDIHEPARPLDIMFKARRNYWSKRYYANSRLGKEQRVVYQLLSAVFKDLQIIVDPKGKCVPNYERVGQILCESAFRYAKKRIKTIPKNVPNITYTRIGMRDLDNWVVSVCSIAPDPAYYDIRDVIQEKIMQFSDDVEEFINHVMLGKNHEKPLPVGATTVPRRVRNDPALNPNLEGVHYKTKKKHSPIIQVTHQMVKPKVRKKLLLKKAIDEDDEWTSSDDEDDDGGGMNYEDSDAEEDHDLKPAAASAPVYVPPRTKEEIEDDFGFEFAVICDDVDLASELKERFPDMHLGDLDAYSNQFGARVSVEKFEEIVQEVDQKRIAALKVAAINLDALKNINWEELDDLE
jgi:hypothetical protein